MAKLSQHTVGKESMNARKLKKLTVFLIQLSKSQEEKRYGLTDLGISRTIYD